MHNKRYISAGCLVMVVAAASVAMFDRFDCTHNPSGSDSMLHCLRAEQISQDENSPQVNYAETIRNYAVNATVSGTFTADYYGSTSS